MQVLSIQNNEYFTYQKSFKGYAAQQICAELCQGACCNHGTPMNSVLKKITDRLCVQYKNIPDNLKSTVLIKTPIVKWVVDSQNPDIISLNNLANIYIDAISRESNVEIIKKLEAELDALNDKLHELIGDKEEFCAVTNPEIKDLSDYEIISSDINICMYKDHGKTNLCTIYDGIKDDEGNTVKRPYACFAIGSDVMPCPWHHPEKYAELCQKTREKLASMGYGMLPAQVIQQYVARQYNLNEVFIEKIWEPFIKKEEANS